MSGLLSERKAAVTRCRSRLPDWWALGSVVSRITIREKTLLAVALIIGFDRQVGAGSRCGLQVRRTTRQKLSWGFISTR